MKVTLPTETEHDAKYLDIAAAVHYNEDDIPNNFPGRDGELVKWRIDIDAKRIIDFKWHEPTRLCMKVVDCGNYALVAADGSTIVEMRNEYVPHGLGEYGDYLAFTIAEDGSLSGEHLDLAEAVESMVENVKARGN